jgi:hypothetical protein
MMGKVPAALGQPLPASKQYFQHLLGYRARNLRFNVIPSGAT